MPQLVPARAGLFVSSPPQRPVVLRREDHIHHSPFGNIPYVAWPLSNLPPPLRTCQIYPVRTFDGHSRYPTFFSTVIHDEIQLKKIPFLLPLVLLASTTLSVPDRITAVAEVAKRKHKVKKGCSHDFLFQNSPSALYHPAILQPVFFCPVKDSFTLC